MEIEIKDNLAMSTPASPLEPSHTPYSPMGPVHASPFPSPQPSSTAPAPLTPPPSKNIEMWQKFLGAGATPEQVEKFQAQFLNAITSEFTKEAAKSRERRKSDANLAEGNPI